MKQQLSLISLGCLLLAVLITTTDDQGNSMLYALNANTGAIYWHSSSIRQVTPSIVV